MTTIREVAKLAGVSYATVSHVVNHTRYVSDDTRQRVLAAMDELNYKPNAIARSLRQGKTNTVGLVLPDSANPFFAEISRSIEDALYKLGFSVILCNTERNLQREAFYVDVLLKKQVDGIIFVAAGDQADSLETVLRQGVPVVLVDRDLPNAGLDAVITDNRKGGYLAVRHLTELGHRRIACIYGPSSITAGAERILGYRQALEEAGIAFDPSLLFMGDYHPDTAFHITNELLEMDIPPTAIFALNDLMALGALHAIARAGRSVPEDLAVVGYDDIELVRFSNPGLTSVAQPKVLIGEYAARFLAYRIDQKKAPTQRVVLPPELIVRGSTQPDAKGDEPRSPLPQVGVEPTAEGFNVDHPV